MVNARTAYTAMKDLIIYFGNMLATHPYYAENLNYNTLSPFFSIDFKQKNFRALGTNKIKARFLLIDREIEKGLAKSDEDQYNLIKVDYFYKKNKLIHNYLLNINTEIASKFTKLNSEFRYRHLTSK